MKKINRKMQTCKAVADGASEVLDGLAKQGIIDSYIVSCCATTPTADGGTDYDSGSTTYGNPDSLVKMMSFIICDIEAHKKIPVPATIMAIMETIKQMKRGAGYSVRQ
ncbi:hypothetical protein [Mitsuokella multacida]|uniref:Uncharacterized protein n=1 Tax=Mitsuokella multacida TaxID=52226 RepID=A0A414NZX9_9FIRM|nr:hypothetical protein [Mitsuokella multacida]RHF53455.1 hypothetical protein DW674_00915 [Mitsuokella multacida]